jgi:hypothetical protein
MIFLHTPNVRIACGERHRHQNPAITRIQGQVKELDPLEKIAELLKTYYNPIQMIEHKYRTKVTAIGLLKSAMFNTPEYLEPYYHRLLSYKGLIRDHTDNMKLAENIAANIFIDNINTLIENFKRTGRESDAKLLDLIITLIYPNSENSTDIQKKSMRKSFAEKYNTKQPVAALATYILRNYLNSEEKYDRLADMIVKRCLTGISQEDVSKRIVSADFNYFVYGLYSRAEATNIYNISLRTKDNEVQQLKYFTKSTVLARSVINQAGSKSATVNFFGSLWEPFEEIKKLFLKNTNIVVMFY